MHVNDVLIRLSIVLTTDELKRISVTEKRNQGISIIADVHGMKCYQAKRFINNLICLSKNIYELIVIHGFNHGTAIRDMLHSNFSNQHIKQMFIDQQNQGVTHMVMVA